VSRKNTLSVDANINTTTAKRVGKKTSMEIRLGSSWDFKPSNPVYIDTKVNMYTLGVGAANNTVEETCREYKLT